MKSGWWKCYFHSTILLSLWSHSLILKPELTRAKFVEFSIIPHCMHHVLIHVQIVGDWVVCWMNYRPLPSKDQHSVLFLCMMNIEREIQPALLEIWPHLRELRQSWNKNSIPVSRESSNNHKDRLNFTPLSEAEGTFTHKESSGERPQSDIMSASVLPVHLECFYSVTNGSNIRWSTPIHTQMMILCISVNILNILIKSKLLQFADFFLQILKISMILR